MNPTYSFHYMYLMIVAGLLNLSCSTDKPTTKLLADIYITNGMVVDGTGSLAVAKEILIRNDSIIYIGKGSCLKTVTMNLNRFVF